MLTLLTAMLSVLTKQTNCLIQKYKKLNTYFLIKINYKKDAFSLISKDKSIRYLSLYVLANNVLANFLQDCLNFYVAEVFLHLLNLQLKFLKNCKIIDKNQITLQNKTILKLDAEYFSYV